MENFAPFWDAGHKGSPTSFFVTSCLYVALLLCGLLVDLLFLRLLGRATGIDGGVVEYQFQHSSRSSISVQNNEHLAASGVQMMNSAFPILVQYV